MTEHGTIEVGLLCDIKLANIQFDSTKFDHKFRLVGTLTKHWAGMSCTDSASAYYNGYIEKIVISNYFTSLNTLPLGNESFCCTSIYL